MHGQGLSSRKVGCPGPGQGGVSALPWPLCLKCWMAPWLSGGEKEMGGLLKWSPETLRIVWG